MAYKEYKEATPSDNPALRVECDALAPQSMENTAMLALRNTQNSFAGEAERIGLETEQDVVDLVKEVRREVWKENTVDKY